MIYDSTTPSIQQYDLSLAGQKPILRPPAGFAESFMQELGLFWRENLSTSRSVALSNAGLERTRKIREVAGDKAFIRALTLSGDPATTAMIEEIAAKHDNIKTDAGLMAEIKERNAALRKERDAALEHQTTGGSIGSFLGVAAGAMSDPLNLLTLPLGASWATGILKTALIEAGINMATEAAIQPAIYRYKKELESPYNVRDVLMNVAGAGVGAAVLTGGVKAGVKAISRFGRLHPEITPRRIDGFDDILEAAERLPNPTDEQRAAIEVLRSHADSVRQSPFEPVAELDDLHLSALAKATDDIEAGRPVDVSEFIEQLEKQTRDQQIAAERARLAKRDEMETGFAALHQQRGQVFYKAGASERAGFSYFADDLKVAEQYAEGGTFGRPGIKVEKYFGSPSIFEATKASKEEIADILGIGAKYLEPDGNISFDALERLPSIKSTLREFGYDGIRVSEGTNGTSIAIINESAAKMRPELATVQQAPTRAIARESQSLGEFIRNSGGVSVERAGALRGEYEALLKGGGQKSGVVKVKAGLSPDELAQRAHEAGFIDDADPYLLKEALERDLNGDKVYSLNSDLFERKIELAVERELDDFDRIMQEEFEEEMGRVTQGRKAAEILEAEDMKITLDDGTTRSAREVIGELDADAKAAAAVKTCLAG